MRFDTRCVLLAIAALGGTFAPTRSLAQTPAPITVGPDSALDAPVTTPAAAQDRPAVAVCGSIALVVFVDKRLGQVFDDVGNSMISIYGRRMRASDGAFLDPRAFLIATAPVQLVSRYSEFAVAASSDTFLVAYSYDDAVRGVRIRASDGVLLDPAGFTISTAKGSMATEPAIASDGTSFLVAWSDNRNPSLTPTGANPDVFGSLVTKDGTVSNTSGTGIDTGLDQAFRPAIEWNGTEYLVGFVHTASGSQSYEIAGHRVSATGSPRGSTFTLVPTADDFDLAFGAGRFVVVYRAGAYASSVGAQWLDANGAAVGSALALGPSTYYPVPSVAWDGASFLATWASRVSDTELQLESARLTTTGTTLDATPAPLGVSIADDGEFIFHVERLGASRFLLAYSRFDAAPESNAVRVFTRIVNAPTPVPVADGGTGGTDGGGAGGGGGGGVGPISCDVNATRSFDLRELVIGFAVLALIAATRRVRRRA